MRLSRGLSICRCVTLAALLIGMAFAPTAKAQQKMIRFAYQKNLFMAPVFVAFEKGWFEQALAPIDYKMDSREFGVGPDIAEAMAGGQIDMGQLGVSVVVTAAGRGLPVKVVANTGIAGEGIVVKADSSIKTIADLRGKTIAIPAKGSLPDFVVRYALEKAGINPARDVEFLEIAAPDMKQALLAGLVDAAVVWEPVVTDMVLGGARVLATGQQIYPNHENDTIAATVDAIKNHPDAVRAIVATIVHSQRWVIDHPDEAIAITAKALNLKRPLLVHAWPNVLRSTDGRPNLETMKTFADALQRWGYMTTKVDAAALIDDQFLPAVR